MRNPQLSSTDSSGRHPEAVQSLLDEQFARILRCRQAAAAQPNNNNSASTSFSSGICSSINEMGGTSPDDREAQFGRHQRCLNDTCSTDGADNGLYILDLSRPGEVPSADDQTQLEIARCDPKNAHLPTCVRGSSKGRTWKKHRKASAGHGENCQGKCCRLYVIQPKNAPLEEGDLVMCKFERESGLHQHQRFSQSPHRSHFDVINRIPVPESSSVTPRESGSSSCSAGDDATSFDSPLKHPDVNCAACGGCTCAQCLSHQPSKGDDCCVDVATCMCCVKGIASFFAATKRNKPRRRVQLPTPTGSTSPKDFENHVIRYDDDSDAEGDCYGLASSNPCSCRGSAKERTFRFACLSILSVCMPCLLCYLPCRALARSVRGCRNRPGTTEPCRCPRSSSTTAGTASPPRRRRAPRRRRNVQLPPGLSDLHKPRLQTAPPSDSVQFGQHNGQRKPTKH